MRATLEAWLGPAGSTLRRARVGLLVALAVLLAWLLGPYAPFSLPGGPTLIPHAGQSRIHSVLVASWYAAALNAVGCALLLGTAARWTREESGPAPPRAAGGLTRSAWLLVLAAAALAGALRWPLAQKSVWWDEAWSLRYTIVGKLDPNADGTALEFRPVEWLDTLWYYRTPTNHVAYSVAARATVAAWRAATGAAPHAFHEFALRFPAWLAAMGAVVLMGLLVHALGFPRAAPAAAFLLAIHPWHIRFGADGRGYSFVVLLTVAGAWLLLRALREDRWRWWLGHAAAQLLLLWTFPLAVYVPLCLTAAAALAIAAGPGAARGRWLRLGVANVLAAMLYLQVMAPNLAQAARLERLLGEAASFDPRWLRQLWVYASTGLYVRMPELPDVSFPTLVSLSESRPRLPWIVFGALPALVLLGSLRVLRRGGGAERAVLLALCAAPLVLVVHRAIDGFFAYPRFAIYAIVPAVALLAIGAEGLLAAPLGSRRGAGRGIALGLALGLAGYQAMLAPLTLLLLRLPHAPAREVAAFFVAEDEGDPRRVLRAGVGLGGDVPRVYDPWLREVMRPEELRALCREARATGERLFVFHGHTHQNRERLPELFALVEDPRLFEPVARFDGIESEHVYRVLRYTGAPLEDRSR